jgi:WD40 repeat protein/energy-coupling factor transporter ATP-binding protein EcfA2
MINIQKRLGPFPGLRAFEKDENDLFFGREEQTDELLQKLRCHRFLAVVGTSGSGKSSLVKAGLLPALHGGYMPEVSSRWRIVEMRPGNNPISNLAKALNTANVVAKGDQESDMRELILETTLEWGTLGLVEAVQQAQLEPEENLLIVVDQFEELFRLKQTPERDDVGEEAIAFVKLLLEAAKHPDLSVYVVLTMRSDYLGDCAQFRGLPETINDSQYLIPRMTRDQLKEAIERPVRVEGIGLEGGAEITPRLVNRLLNDMGDTPDYLPVLQHALMRTWIYWLSHHAPGEPINLIHYESIGGMEKALSNHADEIYNCLPSARHKKIAEILFQRLTDKSSSRGGVRRPRTLKEICSVANASLQEVIEVVDPFRVLECSFLMPPPHITLEEETMIDISHESLMRIWELLQVWIKDEQQSAQIYRRLAGSAILYNKTIKEAGLYKDPELRIALNWIQDHHPNKAWAERYDKHFDEVNDYLNKSKEEYNSEIAKQKEIEQEELDRTRKEVENQKRINQQQLVSGAAIIFSLIAAGFGSSLFFEAQIASKSNTSALFKSSNVLYEERPQNLDALEYALQAIKSSDLGFFNWVPFKDLKIEDQILGKLIQSAYSVREFNKFKGHNAPVNSVSFSNDGQKIASASDDNSIILWDLEENKSIPFKRFKDHKNRVNSISFSPNGQRIASGSEDKTIKIWDLMGHPLQTLKMQKNQITSVSYSPDGKMLASASNDNSIVVWKENNGKFKDFKKLLHNDRVKAVSFSPDGKILASAGWDGLIKLWNLNGNLIKIQDLNGKPNKSQKRSKKQITSLSFSIDGRTIAAGSLDKSVILWNFKDNSVKKLSEQNGHLDRVMSVSFSPDPTYLASASADGTVKIWNTKSNQVNKNLNIPGVISVKFSKNGTLATTDLKNNVRLWKLPEIFPNSVIHNQLAPLSIEATKTYTINSMDLSADGKIIASGESDSKNDGKIVFHDLQTKDLILSSGLKCAGNPGVKFYRNNPSIVLITESCLDSKNIFVAKKSLIEIFDLKLKKTISFLGFTGEIKAIDFSADENKIAIVNQPSNGSSSQITLWDFRNNSQKFVPINKSIEPNTITFRPGYDEIFIGGADGKIYLTDLRGKIKEPFKDSEQHTGGITSLQVSPDGQSLVSGSYDATIRRWNLENSEKNMIIGNHSTSITKLSFNQNNRWLASSSSEGVTNIWSLIEKKEPLLSTLQWEDSSIVGLSFSSDQKVLITASNTKIQIWNTDLTILKKLSCKWLKNYFEIGNYESCPSSSRL